MFIEQDPQTPSRQERRKVSVGSTSFFQLDEGVQHHRAAILGVDGVGVEAGFSVFSGS
jgi:hypothetical protein